MLTGVTIPTSGSIQYFGQDFVRQRAASLQRINFASAYNTLQGRITVQENLQAFAGLYQLKQPKQRIAELMERFEITRLARNRYLDLSAGERTRVNLAKALLNEPELILMDEPTASLDPDIADKTLSLIEELRQELGLSILFTSHNMAEVERICDDVIFLDRGHIVSHDTPENHMKGLGGMELVLRYRGEVTLREVLEHRHDSFELPARGEARIQTTPEQVAQLLHALTSAGVKIHDVDVRKPTLEDVFLAIARRQR